MLDQVSIHAHIQQNQIKTEQGHPLNFDDHLFLFDPYRDLSPKQAILKAAQIGMSTLAIIKVMWLAKNKGLNCIYTLPTANDVNDFVGGKVNKIIAQNPIYQKWTKDRDTIEQKSIGNSTIYYRGTFLERAAIMVSADLCAYDEVDSSKQSIIEQYSTRLQHSKYKWEWYFSHPSAPGTGVDKYWDRSDKKKWHITCPHCKDQHYLRFPQCIDAEEEIFICEKCKVELTDDDRARGEWIATSKGEFSGYWIPLLIAPWVTAKEILDYKRNKSEEYFYNKVLGLPYVGGGNKLTKKHFYRNLTKRILTPQRNERVVIGVDTGKRVHYSCMGMKGLFYYGEFDKGELNSSIEKYEEIEELMKRYPRAIAVIDQGGDILGSRQMREKYPGRVYLCTFGTDRKTKELVRWGKNDEDGAVTADRNRCIQMAVDEFVNGMIPVEYDESMDEWFDFWCHWNALTRIKEFDQTTMEIKRKVWVRSGDDHFAMSYVYARIGMNRFGMGKGSIINPVKSKEGKAPYVVNEQVPAIDPYEPFKKKDDWRNI